MKAKKIVIVVILAVLIIAFGFIPFNSKRQVVIKSSLYDIAREINDLNNWKKWNIDLNDSIKINGSFDGDQSANISSTYAYTLHHLNPLAVSLTRNVNGLSATSLIEIASITDTTTAVIWSERTSLFGLTKGNKSTQYSPKIDLENLKKMMEDPNRKYGFYIRIVPVKDTLILTAETELVDNGSTHMVAYLYNLLESFIKENNLPAEKNYFYTTQLSDSKIAVGIPVYKQTNNQNNIRFLQLPGKGRLVEGNYSGKIADKRSIYTAINNFMLDQHLKQVAQPLEQYNVADTIIQPNDNVDLKIYYPVF